MAAAGLAIAWIIFACVFVAVTIGCYLFVRYMSDRFESSKFTTVVSVSALVCELFALSIIPVDIYNVSSGYSEGSADVIRSLYYAAWCTLFVFEFVILPFAIFWFEEDDENVSPSERACNAAKYTIFFVIIAIVLLVLALTLQFGSGSGSDASGYVGHVLDTSHRGDAAISFLFACMATAGTLGYVAYGGYGLAALPIGMMVGAKSLQAEDSHIGEQLNTIRAQIAQLEARYPGRAAANMKKKDKKEYDELRKLRRNLEARSTRIQQERNSLLYKVSVLCAPFKKFFGAAIFLIALFLMVSLGIATGDRAKNSSCGSSCGYLNTKSQFTNPLDAMFVAFAKAFPLDYVLLSGALLLFYAATLVGIVQIGLRCFCIRLHKVRPGKTPAQGILISCMILTFVILVVTVQLPAFAPDYVNFGNQKNSNGDPCSLADIEKDVSEANQKCHLSEIGKITSRTVLLTPVFGNVFFYTCWAYLASFFFSTGYIFFKGPKDSVQLVDSSDDDDVV
jgi:LMBR1 domain-containing protein 1